ncbi:hypothetical protein PPYR_13339 [Photinus pyralis]|uniref:Uncharacterized protein n=1 Tax=Photinus pyralis TaxID=7054 RepID=A0A5N4A8U5_PHOPY|nr:ankyrin repeat, PH and SEC7 domain containing protein secG-like [Photinus pyralis]KAB0793719.1 hypothetical protein PPYR_13339 [Photinus pyralis]
MDFVSEREVCKETVEVVKSANELGDTALHSSSRFGFVNVTSRLIENGANVNAQNSEGNAPIHLASLYNNNSDTVDVLIAGGASVTILNNEGNSPLMLSAMNDKYHVASTLIKNGAPVDYARNDGATALHIASIKLHAKTVEVLLLKGANVNSINVEGDTPLHMAIAVHGKEIVNLLLGPDAYNKLVNMECAPLDSSDLKKNIDVIRLLIAKGANVFAINKKGQTPLQLLSKNS